MLVRFPNASVSNQSDRAVSKISEVSISGGKLASYPNAINTAAVVAPTTTNENNLISTSIIPIACWRVDDVRFEFDSSFVKPEIARELISLASLRNQYKKDLPTGSATQPTVSVFPPLSIFGHADPVGDDEYNKKLSGRRATAIYALLTRKTDLWEQLYSHPHGRDQWGNNVIMMMLTHLGFAPPPGQQSPSQNLRLAVENFQRANSLSVDGQPGAQTRSKLFLAYMDALCRDNTGQPFELKKEDFLARGEDAGGKGDYQGCSEFNPILLFSQEEQRFFSQAENIDQRNTENSPNRRVMVLLFRPGSKVISSKWVCPRVNENTSGCRKRFWSDGESRRSFREERRQYSQTKDTFVCRFYDRISNNSPCEGSGLRSIFRYGLEKKSAMPWTDNAVLRFYSEDNLQEHFFSLHEGE